MSLLLLKQGDVFFALKDKAKALQDWKKAGEIDREGIIGKEARESLRKHELLLQSRCRAMMLDERFCNELGDKRCIATGPVVDRDIHPDG